MTRRYAAVTPTSAKQRMRRHFLLDPVAEPINLCDGCAHWLTVDELEMSVPVGRTQPVLSRSTCGALWCRSVSGGGVLLLLLLLGYRRLIGCFGHVRQQSQRLTVCGHLHDSLTCCVATVFKQSCHIVWVV
jgi:hypothetical protein